MPIWNVYNYSCGPSKITGGGSIFFSLSTIYPTLSSILPLVTWEPQSNLAFGTVGWWSGLRPSDITILQCAASLAIGGYDQTYRPIKSLFPM